MRAPSNRVRATPTSATVLIADVGAQMRRRGEDIVDFSAGRAAEHTPMGIAQSAADALLGGDTHQTPAAGKPAFRVACAIKLARDNDIVADADTEIIATLGCKQGLTVALIAAIDAGDAPARLIDAMITVQQHLTTCAGSFTQAGAIKALSDGATDELVGLWRDWESRCSFVCATLDMMPGVSCPMPEGGFYAWVDVSALGIPSVQLAECILRDYGVALVPGAAFGPGGEGKLRITCVRSWDELHRGLSRLEAAFARFARRGA